MKKTFLAIIILASLTSCDNNFDLGNGYALMATSINCRSIVKNITSKGADIAVLGHVFDYAHDENFILALQVPQDSLVHLSNFIKLNWKDMDSLSKGFNGNYYYIIDKKNDSTYGPLDKKEYFVVRSNLHIPNSLKLKNGS